jgi:hypothetical protein
VIEQFKDDKSTVFSIVPYRVKEFRPGLYPGSFDIPPCYDDSKPNALIVGASEHIMHVADQKPTRIVTPSFVIAQSIVQDFLDGQLWTTPEAHPGITWMQGKISVENFLTSHKDLFAKMRSIQKSWYVNIVKKTNDEWTKYHNSRVVSDQARFAAKVLGLEPEWLEAETVGFTFSKCPACGTANNSTNAVCTNCRCVLNEDKFKSLKFAS